MLTCLAGVVAGTGFGFAVPVPKKGSGCPIAVGTVTRFLEECGVANHCVLQTDPEPSAVDLARAVASESRADLSCAQRVWLRMRRTARSSDSSETFRHKRERCDTQPRTTRGR